MSGMFYGAKKFNRDISEWDVSNVEFNNIMFLDCNINSDFMPHFKSNMIRI
jgi:surface protein